MNNIHEIIFLKLKVQNFLSIKDIEFDFTKHSGMNYIFGHNIDVGKGDEARNGAGKSALFGDALLFALFGRTGKNLKKSNVVNRIVGKQCVGEVWFMVKGKEYHITNGAAPAFCKIEVKNENGEWETITKSTMAETQTYLCDEILKSSYLMFKKMNVLSIGDHESIYEMGKATKRDFIENVFNLNVFGEMFKMVKTDYNKLDKVILQEQTKYTQLEKDVNIYADKIKNFETEKQSRISSIEHQINTINETNKRLSNATIDINDKFKETQELKAKIVNKVQELDNKINEINSNISACKREQKFKEADIAKYEDVYNTVCDYCQKNLDACIGFSDNKTVLETLAGDIINYNTNKQKFNEARVKLTDKLNTVNNSIDLFEQKRATYENQMRLFESNKAKIELLEENLTLEQNKTSSFDELYEKYNKEKDELYISLSDNIDNRKYLTLLKSMLSEDGIKKHIIATLINALNNRIASYLEEMGSEYTVIFDPNFDCQFLTTTGECEYNNFSAGEKMRINHATMFAFQDIISTQGNLKTNILYCDELIDVSVDTVAIQAFLNILRRKVSDGQTIYLISHREAIADDEFDNIIEIKKEGGFTEIVNDPQGKS